LALVRGVLDEFARKRAGDENGLAINTRYPPPFLIKRLYLRDARNRLSPHLQTSSRQEIAASDSLPIPTASPAPARTRVDTAHRRARRAPTENADRADRYWLHRFRNSCGSPRCAPA